MKPAPIYQYLDQSDRAGGDRPWPRREATPFRPRSLTVAAAPEPRSPPASERLGKDSAFKILARKAATPGQSPAPSAAASQHDIAAERAAAASQLEAKLAEAEARGRDAGYAAAQAEAARERARDLTAAHERALAERLEFRLKEYAAMEGAIRRGLAEIEERIGASVGRILASFLNEEVAKRAVEDLGQAIGRLCAGDGCALMTIRGPERLLGLLKRQLIDLAVEIKFAPAEDIEITVEADDTAISTTLKPWSELLCGLGA